MDVKTYEAFQTYYDLNVRKIIEQQLASTQDLISTFYTVETSDRRTEQVSSSGENPEWTEFTGQLQMSRNYEQYLSTAMMRTFIQGVTIARDAYDDDQSGILRDDQVPSMARALTYTRQGHAAWPFNTCTSLDSYWWTLSEAVPLVSLSHTTKTPGVSTASGFSNLLVGGLTKANYRTAQIQMSLLRNDQGQLGSLDGNLLLTTTADYPLAQEIVRTPYGVDTPFRNVNPEYQSAEVMKWNRLTQTGAWFLINKELMKRSLTWWERVKPEYHNIKDFITFALMYSGYGRWAPHLLPQWRWLVAGIP